jgi:hypothetical protein
MRSTRKHSALALVKTRTAAFSDPWWTFAPFWVGERLASWLVVAETASLIANLITAALPYFIRSMASEGLREFHATDLGERLRQTDLSLIVHGAGFT